MISIYFLLFLCITINAFIGVVFKYFDDFKVKTLPAIVFNYFVCVLVGSLVLGKPAVTVDIIDRPWFFYAMGIGFLFVITFNLFAQTVQRFDIVTGTLFQKISLIAPTIVAIVAFSEDLTFAKGLGIFLAFLSIFMMTHRGEYNKEKKFIPQWWWIFPFGTFVGSCFIDVGFLLVSANKLASAVDVDFVSSIFFFAGLLGLVFLVYDRVVHGNRFSIKELLAGITLGIPNFFSIYLLVMVLSGGLESSVVFPINNVGILIMAVIFGYFLFRQSIGGIKGIGLLLAIVSIGLIAMG